MPAGGHGLGGEGRDRRLGGRPARAGGRRRGRRSWRAGPALGAPPGEVLGQDHVAGEGHGDLDHRLQLADVAGPGVRLEPGHRRGRDAPHRDVEAGRVALDEVLGEALDVALAVAQRRRRDDGLGEAVVEVHPEGAAVDRLEQVDVGGGHQADVEVLGLAPADPLDGALLQHAEELGLDVQREVADLVEEEGAPVRALEMADARGHRPGEGALLVPEELALDEVLRQHRAVDGDEGPRAPLARGVDGAREELFAGARLARDEDVDVGPGQLDREIEGRAEGRRLADQGALRRGARLAARRRNRVERPEELGLDEGLDHEVDRPALEGAHRHVDVGLPGHDDHRDARGGLVEARQRLEAVDARHLHVEQDDVGPRRARARPRAEQRQRGLARIGRGDAVPLAAEQPLEDAEDRRLVVDREDA